MSAVVPENSVDLTPQVIYQPQYKETQLIRFKNFVEDIYNIKLQGYWELHDWSCKHFPEFWDCVWRFFDIKYSQPYTQAFDRKNSFQNMEWFKGVRFNYAENVFKYRDSHMAIIGTDEEDNTQYVTYKELYDEVCVYVKALKDLGIQKGDVVACYMSNKIEAVFAFLATATIGAIWSGSLPLMGAKGTLARFEQINPKIIFTAGNFFFEDKEIRMDNKISEVVSGLPSLQKVVFVPSRSKRRAEVITGIPHCVFLSEFLEHARNELRNNSSALEFEQVPFEHPLCISYTSGTTGAPKCLIHTTGMFLGSLKDYGLHQDCTRKDVLFNFSPVGWISWNMFVNCLHLGLTVIMYEGDAFEKSPTRYWDLVDKFGITSSYVWSSTVENMETKGCVPTSKHSLKTLRQLFPMGSPAKPHSFNFLSEKVKPNLFCSPLYGCSEMFSSISGVDSNLPVHKGELQVVSLGMDIRILDEKGNPVIGKRGNLVLANPYPACTISLLNDENQEMMREIYLSQHPGYWNIADDAWQNPVTKGLIVYGRSDETMNPLGARFNCSEIYFALEKFPGILNSICVSQFNSNMDERVVLFVKMNPPNSLNPAIEHEIRTTIEHHLTIEHVPALIIEAPDIPYNLTGKKLNGYVKKLINKKPILNSEIVVNPSSVEFYKTVDLGRF